MIISNAKLRHIVNNDIIKSRNHFLFFELTNSVAILFKVPRPSSEITLELIKSISFLVFFGSLFLLLELLKTPSDYLKARVFMSWVSAGNSVLLTINVRQKLDSSSWLI